MRITKILGATFAVIMVISALVAVSASAALPELLPEPTAKAPVSFTGISKAGTVPTLKTEGKAVECTKAKGSGSATSPKLGTFTIVFEGCKETTASTKCTGLSDKTEGNITTEGEFHVWRGWLVDSTGKEVEHKAVVVFLPKHVHFACVGGITLFLVLGCAAGLLNEPNVLVSLLTATLVENAKKTGVNDITLVENEKKEKIGCELKTSINEAAKESPSVEIATAELKEFKQNGVAITVLLMA